MHAYTASIAGHQQVRIWNNDSDCYGLLLMAQVAILSCVVLDSLTKWLSNCELNFEPVATLGAFLHTCRVPLGSEANSP